MSTPTCAYCDATEDLRQLHDGGGYTAPDYTCADCFTGTDTGPGFDDLPLPPETVATEVHPQRYPVHADPLKGQVIGGECNITRCDRWGAAFWNMGTFGLYCPECAFQINKANRGKPPLCVRVAAKPLVADAEKFRRDHGYYEIFA